MPELAEVEFYRKQWNPGLGCKVLQVELHPQVRIFHRTDTQALQTKLSGKTLTRSETHGKQMLFRLQSHLWLGIHLGMTGSMQVESIDYQPSKHDHLILRQVRRTLVFKDPRQFGRILFHAGQDAPTWWRNLPPEVVSDQFTLPRLENFLKRHARLSLKATLLLQEGFPGVGNWMADEILWRSRLHPGMASGKLTGPQLKVLWRQTRWVSQRALETIGIDWSGPPRGWLFHERWRAGGDCPRDGVPLERDTIGGRTTAWCGNCQS
jgi:formamidopyrimidine-DNA glycosylase